MNKILLHDVTPYIGSQIQSVEYEDVSYLANVFNPANKYKVIKYANLDGMGTNLEDYTVEAGSDNDYVGLVSQYKVETGTPIGNDYPSIMITFANPIDLTKGATIKFHEDADGSCKISDVHLTFYRSESDYSTVIFYTNDYEDSVDFSFEDIISVKVEVRSIGNGVTPSQGNTIKIDYIDFGTDVEIDGFIGDISVYSEIALEKNDTPAGTCDFTIQTDRELMEGQQFKLLSNHYEGSYVIEQVTREAEDVYTVQAHDYVQEMESHVLDPSVLFSELGCPTDLVFINDIMADYSSDTETLRQFAAYLLTTQNFYIIGFKSDGIRSITPTTDYLDREYTADDILGRASYQNRKNYYKVYIEYVNENDPYSPLSKESATLSSQIGSAGRLELTDWKARIAESGDSYEQAKNRIAAMVDNAARFCNGNEVEFSFEYTDEDLGDYVSVETPYNGTVNGIIRSLELTIGKNKTVAKAIMREVTPSNG